LTENSDQSNLSPQAMKTRLYRKMNEDNCTLSF
jgi:hypothetical protein